MDATECVHQMTNELEVDTNRPAEQAIWILGERLHIVRKYHRLCDNSLSDFKRRLSQKLENLGDVAMYTKRHDEAISGYSAALSLVPASQQGLFIKRSEAYVASGLWENALEDADGVRLLLSRRLGLLDAMASSSGDNARSIVSMGLREKTRSFTQGRTL